MVQQRRALRRQDKYAEAIHHFDKAIEIDPAYSKAWNSKGLALKALRQRLRGRCCLCGGCSTREAKCQWVVTFFKNEIWSSRQISGSCQKAGHGSLRARWPGGFGTLKEKSSGEREAEQPRPKMDILNGFNLDRMSRGL